MPAIGTDDQPVESRTVSVVLNISNHSPEHRKLVGIVHDFKNDWVSDDKGRFLLVNETIQSLSMPSSGLNSIRVDGGIVIIAIKDITHGIAGRKTVTILIKVFVDASVTIIVGSSHCSVSNNGYSIRSPSSKPSSIRPSPSLSSPHSSTSTQSAMPSNHHLLSSTRPLQFSSSPLQVLQPQDKHRVRIVAVTFGKRPAIRIIVNRFQQVPFLMYWVVVAQVLPIFRCMQ